MQLSASAPEARPVAPSIGSYRPGACNIGPAEIARRRQFGHLGVAASVALLAFLVAIGASPLARLALVLPAGMAASGYLQAWLRFCAGFGSRGVFNFGPLGQTERVVGANARARDHRRATEIGLASLAIGVAVAVGAALLPV